MMTQFKEVGTLAEIGAKVGDVVEFVSPPEAYDHGFEVDPSDREWLRDPGSIFRIVSRATPGPVITETDGKWGVHCLHPEDVKPKTITLKELTKHYQIWKASRQRVDAVLRTFRPPPTQETPR